MQGLGWSRGQEQGGWGEERFEDLGFDRGGKDEGRKNRDVWIAEFFGGVKKGGFLKAGLPPQLSRKKIRHGLCSFLERNELSAWRG